MSKKFAVFDIDGTLIRWQLYHAIADQLVKLGYVEAGVYDSVHAARMNWKRRAAGASFRTYELELIRVYNEVMKTLSTSELEEAIKFVFDEYKDQVYTYTRNLIKELKSKDYLVFAISGSHQEIVELIAKYYRFDDFIGTTFEREGQRFTGNFHVGSHHKDLALQELVDKHRASFKGSVAVGDSKSDAAMMELVDQPIAFNPDHDLYEIAHEKGWKIVVERKNMIYELEYADGKYQLDKTS